MEDKLIEKIENSAKDIKNIKMTYLEKDKILKNILDSKSHSPRAIKSPYSFWATISKNHFVYYVAIFVLIILGGELSLNKKQNVTQNIIPDNTNTIIPPVTKNIASPINNNSTTQPKKPSQNEIPASYSFATMTAPATTGSVNYSIYNNTAQNLFNTWMNDQGITNYKINNTNYLTSKANASESQQYLFTSEASQNAYAVKIEYSEQNGTSQTSVILVIDKQANGEYKIIYTR